MPNYGGWDLSGALLVVSLSVLVYSFILWLRVSEVSQAHFWQIWNYRVPKACASLICCIRLYECPHVGDLWSGNRCRELRCTAADAQPYGGLITDSSFFTIIYKVQFGLILVYVAFCQGQEVYLSCIDVRVLFFFVVDEQKTLLFRQTRSCMKVCRSSITRLGIMNLGSSNCKSVHGWNMSEQ